MRRRLSRLAVCRPGLLQSCDFRLFLDNHLTNIVHQDTEEDEMSDQFVWQEVETKYRETRKTKHGEELRWLVNREKILNKATGRIAARGAIRHPGVCVIAPFVDDDHIALMRQYRYVADGELWELPAGTPNGREENQRMIATETP